ncbi:phosphodiester glycosidase family protein, partial [Thermoanaerobacter thermohydrosulfuricus]
VVSSIVYTVAVGNKVDWSVVVEAVGAGPTLVSNGEINVDPVSEGFTEAKILSLSFARTAIGVIPQGDILLVTVPNATV